MPYETATPFRCLRKRKGFMSDPTAKHAEQKRGKFLGEPKGASTALYLGFGLTFTVQMATAALDLTAKAKRQTTVL